jgi:type II secretory ATPase GspE/PulE/Tfp pilus assembly ATPase PilB-like protein
MGTKDTLVGRFLGNAEKFSDKQIAETLDMLVEHGFTRGASDIHIEPHELFVLVRYRIDGNLRGIHKLPRQSLGGVIAQLKKMAELQVQETNTPQEGQYDVRIAASDVTVHVSIMPVFGGEKAVLHLVARSSKLEPLEPLGFWGDGLCTLQSVLTAPHGLVLVAGPRHSGVSATMFSLLSQLNTPLVGIATVETRVKHRLRGAGQTYVHQTGLNVYEGLQAALKQDPNIIMVNELQGANTAELAVHAATTGHLMIVGMHADSAIAATLRMRVAGVEPFLLVTALRASVGQRLVRRLCPVCRERYTLNANDTQQLDQSFGIHSAAAHARIHELERQAVAAGIGEAQLTNSTADRITHLWKARPEGCDNCSHTGYTGRTALIEVLASTDTIHKYLMNSEISSVNAIQKAVLKDGFVPMALDGLIKALRGETTPADVLRTIRAGTLA